MQTPKSINRIGTVELKTLAEGFHSAVNEAFIAVVRDGHTYEQLTKLDPNLPRLDEVFFKANAVIAAYLGTRNTGGYSVDFRQDVSPSENAGPEKIFVHVAEQTPGKDVMVPQVITSPFKVVSVAVRDETSVYLMLDYAWRKQLQLYRITNGEFTMTGGVAGTREEFRPHGELLIMRADDSEVVTLYITMAASGANKERFLTDFATGTIGADGKVKIAKLSAVSFVDYPNSGLQATGTLREGKLNLNFVSLPTSIADSYRGKGQLVAMLTEGSRP